MRIGVPLVPGTDPLALAFLERLVAQADAELALMGDARRLALLRIAAEPRPVPLWGGGRITPDALLRDRPAVDVLVLLGAAVHEAVPPELEELILHFIRETRGDAQHILATAGGILWAMRAGLTAGRRVVLDQMAPKDRARFDATLAARSDPARDGDLWTASDPPRFALLLVEFFAALGGFTLADRIMMRLPWMQPFVSAFAPVPRRGGAGDDDDGDGERPDTTRPGGAGGVHAAGGRTG
jgi:transcriptional regulator GlxA family with amidase domain